MYVLSPVHGVAATNVNNPQLTYPINNYPVGGGVKENIDIGSNTQTNFTFPFSLNYNVSDTSSTAVLQDIVTKCKAKQDLTVEYNLKVSH